MDTPRPRLPVAVRSVVALVAGAFLLLAGGCGEEALQNLVDPPIGVSAGSGTTPVYRWDGGPVFSVSVARLADVDFPVWTVRTPGDDGIASPLTHGVVPSGAVETPDTEKILTAGVGYRVTVERLDGSSGSVDFTP